MIDADAPTLFDLLARRWETGAPVVAAAFSRDAARVSFLGDDGKLWRTGTADAESVDSRFRVAADTGRSTISPRRKAVPALSSSVVDDTFLCIAPFNKDGFAVGSRSGRVMAMSAAGRLSALEIGAQPISAIASTSNGREIFSASEKRITRYRADGSSPRILADIDGRLSAFAASQDGSTVAWLDSSGLHVRRPDAERKIDMDMAAGTEAGALAWSRSGHWLASTFARNELLLFEVGEDHTERTIRLSNYPANAGTLSWSRGSDRLATSGAYRIVVWDFDELCENPSARPPTRQTGPAGYVLVSTVAFHPTKPIVAAGYENGSITVAQVGQSDELVLRNATHGHVTVACWSDDGNYLALGTSEGEAIVTSFPSGFFK